MNENKMVRLILVLSISFSLGCNDTKTEISLLEKQISELSSEIVSLRQIQESTSKLNVTVQSELTDATKNLDAVNNKLAECSSQMERAKQRAEKAEQRLTTEQSSALAAKAKIAMLEMQIRELKNALEGQPYLPHPGIGPPGK